MEEGDIFHRNDVILDGGANTSRFANVELLLPHSIQMNGGHIEPVETVGGHLIHSSASGLFKAMGIRIGVSNCFKVNILSLHEMETRAHIVYEQGQYFEMTPRFKNGRGLTH